MQNGHEPVSPAAAAGSLPGVNDQGPSSRKPGGPRIPTPPPSAPIPLIAVGTSSPTNADAEDFSRRIGNWGTAARDIGDRWEVVGPDLLRRRLPWSVPTGGGRSMQVVSILCLDSGQSGQILQRAGVSAPDLLLIGQIATSSGPKLALRATDLKVSLDTADRAQTSQVRLQACFGRIASGFPAVENALLAEATASGEGSGMAVEAIRLALAADWDTVAITEGLFVAPDSGFNRWFLEEVEQRRRSGRPPPRLLYRSRRRDEPSGALDAGASLGFQAHLEPIAARDFLGGLAGWPEAAIVAKCDGIDLDAVDIAVAERCWRVGNGLRGALLAISRRLFLPPTEHLDASGNPRDVVSVLRQVAARHSGTSEALIEAISTALEARRARWDAEATLLAFPVPYATWAQRFEEVRRDGTGGDGASLVDEVAELLASDGSDQLSASGEEDAARRLIARSTRTAHREAHQRHRERVLAEARLLIESGVDETGMIAQLEARRDDWSSHVMDDAGVLARPSTP